MAWGWKTNLLFLTLGVYLFICSLSGLKDGWVFAFATEGKENLAKTYVDRITGKPLSALCAGIIATALIQSSSGVVAVCIATVAAGGMTVVQSIPFVMGANIGTTITSVLIALGYSLRRMEFSRAVPVAIVNDVFKTLNVALFFIIELHTHILSKTSEAISKTMGGMPFFGSLLGGFPDFIEFFTNPLVVPVESVITSLFGKTLTGGLILGIVSFSILLSSLELMSKAAQNFVRGRASEVVDRAFKTPVRGVIMGSSITWFLQSSSVATALAVPFAASGVITFKRVYPYILGCNIGTTIDPGQIISYIKFGVVGLSVGLVHVLLNVVGVVFWLTFPVLRDVPPKIALKISGLITSSRRGGLSLIVFTSLFFFIIPAIVIYFGW